MNQQKIQVESILKDIRSISRKNSEVQIRQIGSNQNLNNQSEQQNPDEELVIRKSDLRSIIQKMANQHQQQAIFILEKEKEFKDYFRLIQKNQLLLQQYKLNFQTKEKNYKKMIEESQAKLNAQRKEKQQLLLEYNWAKNKIKQQLKEIERYKNSTQKQGKKQELNRQPNNESSYRIISKKKLQNGEKKSFVTPGKEQLKKLNNYVLKYSESIESNNLLNQLNGQNDDLQTMAAKQNLKEKYIDKQQKIDLSFNKYPKYNIIHKTQQNTQKDRLLKLLGQKCLALEAQIEKLTKKYLGQVVFTNKNSSDKNLYSRLYENSQPESITPFSQCSSKLELNRKDSGVQLSGAFKTHQQDF